MSATAVLSRPSPTPTKRSGGGYFFVAGALICAVMALFDLGPLPLRIAAGLLVLVVPVVLVNAKINWPSGTELHESLLYSLALVVLGLMIGGLAIDCLLPLVGIDRPLDRVPVVATMICAQLALALWRPRRWRVRDGLPADAPVRIRSLAGRRDQVMLVCGAILIVGSVAGPIRLNNGAGGAATTTMLIFAAVFVVMLFSWRHRLRESTVMAGVYALSLALLLMTSLRGWFITGHDIQREFRLFQHAAGEGVWNVDVFHSAYNACLSITILPTLIERVTGVPDLYIFKAVFQSLYALCPVLIYLIARRFAPRSVAILAVVYFVAYPTYFGDMPFLNRQEIAFFFLGTAVLLMTKQSLPVRWRRFGFVVFGIGIVLSHYSTTYVLLAVMTFCWLFRRAAPMVRNFFSNGNGRHRRPSLMTDPPVFTWPVVVILAALTFLWAGPITGAGGQVEQTVSSTVSSLTSGGDGGQRSSDASYAVIGSGKQSAEKRLRDFSDQAVKNTANDRRGGANYPLSEVESYQLPVVPSTELPTTAVGDVVADAGIQPSTINGLMRKGAPVLLQLCIALGFAALLIGRASGFNPSLEFLCGAFACIAAIALQVVLPQLSVDYGILRAFGQGLFWLAPFLAAGSIYAFSWLGRRRSRQGALVAALVFFLSLTGVIPQVLGGYPPQLHLNNAGEYYDNCYVHSQEASAVSWLQAKVAHEKTPDVQSHLYCYVYAFTPRQKYGEPSDGDDIFPVLLRRDAYTFVGFTTVQTGEVALSFAGDTVTYRYPMELLDKNKSLIYSSNGAKVYR